MFNCSHSRANDFGLKDNMIIMKHSWQPKSLKIYLSKKTHTQTNPQKTNKKFICPQSKDELEGAIDWRV